MEAVGIAELRNGLSGYLRKVRQGEEILVRDRNTPIAKIVPLSKLDEFDEETLALAAKGVLRLPEKSLKDLDMELFRPRPGEGVPLEQLIDAVVAARDDDE
jgi:prevent-host-death family protein